MKKLVIGLAETIIIVITVFLLYYYNHFIFVDTVAVFTSILFLCSCLCHTKSGKYFFQYIRGYYYKLKLKKCGKRFKVEENVRFMHPQNIEFGDSCDIAQNALFAPLYSNHDSAYPSRIIIGNRVHIGAFDRIASMNEVRIDDDVLFAAFVHITDHSHDYHDIDNPIKYQGVITKGPVHICKGAWLAFGCHILSGVTVGENSVVAANSVVTKNVPPYTIVAGNPAKIIKQFDFKSGEWKSVKKNN